MTTLNPSETVADMLGKKSTALALETADRHLKEYETTGPILANHWRTVKGLLIERKMAEDKAAEDAETARVEGLAKSADKDHAAFLKLKGVKA